MNDIALKLEEFGYMLEDGWVAIVTLETILGDENPENTYFVGALKSEKDCEKERGELASTLFDQSLRGMYIWQIALRRKYGCTDLLIRTRKSAKGGTNITGEVMDGIMKLMMPMKLKEAAE